MQAIYDNQQLPLRFQAVRIGGVFKRRIFFIFSENIQ
jgi:hypothetical protein